MEIITESNKHWKRRFYIIAAGQAVSYIGSSAVQFALIWWLTKETGSALMLSLAGLFAFLPQTLLGPFAGVWVDRLKRKTVMVSADLFTGFIALVFAGAFFIGSPPYWLACVVLGLRAIGGVFHGPALQAAITLLVPKEELIKANSINQFIFVGTFMLGPILGAAMSTALPMEYILISDMALALIACLAIAVVKIPELVKKEHEEKHFFRELKEGAYIYLEDKKLLFLTVSSMIVMVFIMPSSSLYPLLVSEHFGGNEWHLSIVQIVYGAGMMAGAGVTGALGKKITNKIALSMFGLFLFSITMFLLGILPPTQIGFWLCVGVCVIMGAANNVYNIPYMTYMQETISPEKQGRAFSLLNCLMSLTMPLGLLIAGPVAEVWGVLFFFMVSGGISFAVTIVCMVMIKRNI
ncbi:MFS transporter [Spirochaetia bacterium]|nr:MFS transporter [Spirochaetia bacterium]GHU31995.1 MFS transporter [Spirochaetia bacterium]